MCRLARLKKSLTRRLKKSHTLPCSGVKNPPHCRHRPAHNQSATTLFLQKCCHICTALDKVTHCCNNSSHLSLNREGRCGTTDDSASSFLHFSLFSTALWDMPNSRPVHFLMLSSHLFLCLPCLLPPFTKPCKMVLARPDERET